ncbi:hypothetical protein BD289DRAFT_229782 [Coniella lustricola]|uniref:Uncharacterized protein n=1 Tax=Coniella lustricola TaxID=2025994 RepID=A0A2T3AA73_9PEZI|nr:hypothetical protein BD289DRAFT_229782 [Coniella lustricola]
MQSGLCDLSLASAGRFALVGRLALAGWLAFAGPVTPDLNLLVHDGPSYKESVSQKSVTLSSAAASPKQREGGIRSLLWPSKPSGASSDSNATSNHWHSNSLKESDLRLRQWHYWMQSTLDDSLLVPNKTDWNLDGEDGDCPQKGSLYCFATALHNGKSLQSLHETHL